MSDLHWVWAIGWQGGGGGSSEPGGIISEKALVRGYWSSLHAMQYTCVSSNCLVREMGNCISYSKPIGLFCMQWPAVCMNMWSAYFTHSLPLLSIIFRLRWSWRTMGQVSRSAMPEVCHALPHRSCECDTRIHIHFIVLSGENLVWISTGLD